MNQLAGIKKEIINSPIMEAVMNQKESIEEIQREIAVVNIELGETEEKIIITRELGFPLHALKGNITKGNNRLQRLQKSLKAYQEGYVEIPNLGEGQQFEDSVHWGFRITPKVPLRVLVALKLAKEAGFFEQIRIQIPTSQRRGDPIIVGINGNRHFYITSWR